MSRIILLFLFGMSLIYLSPIDAECQSPRLLDF